MKSKKQTVREWEQAFGIALLEFIGVTANENKLLKLSISRKQFEELASECTVIDDITNEIAEGIPSEERVNNRIRISKRVIFFLVVFTMPAFAIVIFDWIYHWIKHWFRIKWYVPAGCLFVSLIVLILQPITPLIAGPGYLWYQMFNFLYHTIREGLALGEYHILHQSLNLTDASAPLFSNIKFHGYPVNLYFHLSEAIASSIFWAIATVGTRDMYKKIKTNRKQRNYSRRRRPC